MLGCVVFVKGQGRQEGRRAVEALARGVGGQGLVTDIQIVTDMSIDG